MPALREVQFRFAGHLFGQPDDRLPELIDSHGLAAERRLQVSRNNVFIGLMEALQALYPVVEKLVGETFFRQAARRYVAEHPSRSGNILDYGDRFPEFLSAAPGLEALPYLPEIAALEWNVHRAFHAADAGSLEPAALAAVPPERFDALCLALHPTSHLAASRHPLFDIWQLATGQGSLEKVDLDRGPDRLLVLRRGLRPELHRLSEGEYLLLSGLAAGRTLGESYGEAAGCRGGLDLQEALARQFRLGTFTGFSLAG